MPEDVDRSPDEGFFATGTSVFGLDTVRISLRMEGAAGLMADDPGFPNEKNDAMVRMNAIYAVLNESTPCAYDIG